MNKFGIRKNGPKSNIVNHNPKKASKYHRNNSSSLQLQNIMPDAVHNSGTAHLRGGKIDNLLTVDKDRIYMAGVGAVKELSGITENIIDKIDQLEEVRAFLLGSLHSFFLILDNLPSFFVFIKFLEL